MSTWHIFPIFRFWFAFSCSHNRATKTEGNVHLKYAGPQLFPPLIAPPSYVSKGSIFAPAPAPESQGGIAETPASSTVPSTGSLPGLVTPANGPAGSATGVSSARSLKDFLSALPIQLISTWLVVKFVVYSSLWFYLKVGGRLMMGGNFVHSKQLKYHSVIILTVLWCLFFSPFSIIIIILVLDICGGTCSRACIVI